MRATYEGVFATLFEWNLARWSGNVDMASFVTAIGLGALHSMNFMALVGIVVLFHGPLTNIPHGVLGAIGVSPLAITYNAFVRRNRYVEVVRRFKRRSTSKQRRTKILTWTYFVVSLAAPLLVALAFPKP